jgi:hypothetical protein
MWRHVTHIVPAPVLYCQRPAALMYALRVMSFYVNYRSAASTVAELYGGRSSAVSWCDSILYRVWYRPDRNCRKYGKVPFARLSIVRLSLLRCTPKLRVSQQYYVGSLCTKFHPNLSWNMEIMGIMVVLGEVKVPFILVWPYTEGTWLYCDYFIGCVICTVVVWTGFVMCGCVCVWVL